MLAAATQTKHSQPTIINIINRIREYPQASTTADLYIWNEVFLSFVSPFWAAKRCQTCCFFHHVWYPCPPQEHLGETLSTLRFASKVPVIINCSVWVAVWVVQLSFRKRGPLLTTDKLRIAEWLPKHNKHNRHMIFWSYRIDRFYQGSFHLIH